MLLILSSSSSSSFLFVLFARHNLHFKASQHKRIIFFQRALAEFLVHRRRNSRMIGARFCCCVLIIIISSSSSLVERDLHQRRVDLERAIDLGDALGFVHLVAALVVQDLVL
jgi:hypothetical protein